MGASRGSHSQGGVEAEHGCPLASVPGNMGLGWGLRKIGVVRWHWVAIVALGVIVNHALWVLGGV